MSEKKNRTIIITFILMIAVSLIVGYLIGAVATKVTASQTIAELFDLLKENLIRIMPYAAFVLNLIMCLIGFCLFAKNNKMAESWDGEDETVIDRIEIGQNIALIIPSIMMILNFLFFGIGFAVDTNFKDGLTPRNIGLGLAFLTFILSFVWETVLQGRVIGLEKKLNPEKRGNILDVKFRKEWIESCDEAERMNIYRSAYDVYKLMSSLFIYAWLFSFIVSAATGIGLFAMVIVTILWLCQTIAYFVAATKYQ